MLFQARFYRNMLPFGKSNQVPPKVIRESDVKEVSGIMACVAYFVTT